MNDREPFFLVGAVRSGTTVLRLMLGHHPSICRCDEFEYVASAIPSGATWPDVHEYVASLPHRRDFRASGYSADPSKSFQELARDFLRQRQESDKCRIVGATVHNHFDRLPRIWPGARYIYLVRDPRDVARSCVQMGWGGNAWSATAIWEEAQDAWRRLRSSLPPDRWMELKFESLVANTESELTRICSFLGVDYDPTMLEIEKDTTYRRPSPRDSKSWRVDAPQQEVREMETRLGARLLEAGYEPSGLPPFTSTPLHRLTLRIDNKMGRMRFAQKRYGIGLWAAAMVSRRLPFTALRNRSQLAIDCIDERYLK